MSKDKLNTNEENKIITLYQKDFDILSKGIESANYYLDMNTEDDLYLLHQFIDEGEYGMAISQLIDMDNIIKAKDIIIKINNEKSKVDQNVNQLIKPKQVFQIENKNSKEVN